MPGTDGKGKCTTDTSRWSERLAMIMRLYGMRHLGPRSRFIGCRHCAFDPIHQAASLASLFESWCRGEDSNLHGLPHLDLNQARLPIPPPRHALRNRLPDSAWPASCPFNLLTGRHFASRRSLYQSDCPGMSSILTTPHCPAGRAKITNSTSKYREITYCGTDTSILGINRHRRQQVSHSPGRLETGSINFGCIGLDEKPEPRPVAGVRNAITPCR